MSLDKRFFGVTIGTVLLVIAVAIIVRMYGNRIPVLSAVG